MSYVIMFGFGFFAAWAFKKPMYNMYDALVAKYRNWRN